MHRKVQANKDTAQVCTTTGEPTTLGMRSSLSNVDWNMLDSMSVEEAWKYIKERINENVQIYVIYTKTKHRSTKAIWFNKILAKKVKRKHSLWKKYVEPDQQ